MSMMDRYWKIVLLSDDIMQIEKEGSRRDRYAAENGYNRTKNDTTARTDIIGAAGEWAANMVYGNTYPFIFYTGNRLNVCRSGDFLDFGEVKTADNPPGKPRNLMCNKSNLKEERPYVLVLTWEYPKCLYIAGWAFGREIKQGRETPGNGKLQPAWILDINKLRTVEALFDIIRTQSDAKRRD